MIPFIKYHGAGNDFILMDNRTQTLQLSRAGIAALCHRRWGIGADGLMLLQNVQAYDFEMVYYNADGGRSSMCGNGGRCIASFAQHLGIVGDKGKFLAADGVHHFVLHQDGTVSLSMNDVRAIQQRSDKAFVLDTGSPHYVRWVAHADAVHVVEEGRKVRYHEEFKKEGINVNFLQPMDSGIYVRTYERGVEDETLSCGTGVTACAIASTGTATGKFEVPVRTPGGHLVVSFEKSSTGAAENIWLKGPVVKVFEGAVTPISHP